MASMMLIHRICSFGILNAIYIESKDEVLVMVLKSCILTASKGSN